MVPEVTTIVIVQILDIQVMKTIMLFFCQIYLIWKDAHFKSFLFIFLKTSILLCILRSFLIVILLCVLLFFSSLSPTLFRYVWFITESHNVAMFLLRKRHTLFLNVLSVVCKNRKCWITNC